LEELVAMKQAGKEDAALEKQIEVGAPREGGGGRLACGQPWLSAARDSRPCIGLLHGSCRPGGCPATLRCRAASCRLCSAWHERPRA